MPNSQNDMSPMTPTDFVAVVNQTLKYAYSSVTIVGEVASFKINQGKWVFFDIKDDATSVSCFMSLWSMKQPLEDGMKVVVRGVPKLTKWGKFSFTVTAVQPVGEGSIKKAYEMLKKKLAAEGLFDSVKKRGIPDDLTRLGVISSTGAAGYADFIKIINARWGGMKVSVAHTQVQGLDAPEQIVRALKYFNERGEVQMIAILRGGGSADDLSCFNDEGLVRAIAASKIPVITGIGHEVDESLSDLAADVRASTPSNAAEMLTRDRVAEAAKCRRVAESMTRAVMDRINVARNENRQKCERIASGLNDRYIEPMKTGNREKVRKILDKIFNEYRVANEKMKRFRSVLDAVNPENVLRQGYAILSGRIDIGNVVKITTFEKEIEATINTIKERK